MSTTVSADMAVDDTVKFDGDNRWWTVRAADTRFVILTRQAAFKPKGDLVYTIIDWGRGLRGPSNKIGQGWGVEEPGGCEALLRCLNLGRGEEYTDAEGCRQFPVEVSYRNNVPIEIIEVRSKGAA